MPGGDFAAARGRLFQLHAAGDYATALEFARSAARDFPDEADRTTYWIACLLARLGDEEGALQAFEEGSRRGLWWGPEALENDPDLETLHTSDRFRVIVEAGRAAHAAAGARPPAEPIVRPPATGQARAALVVLHARGERTELAVERWTGAADLLLIVPHSTQAFDMRSGCWDDSQVAEADVHRAVDAVLAGVDAKLPLLIAGFSQGAALAVYLAAERRPRGIDGCIAVALSAGWARELIGPGLQPLDNQRFVLLIGTLDPRHDDCLRLADQLRAAGAEVSLDVIEGLAHDYPADFGQRLPAAVDWVLPAGDDSGS